MALAESDLNRLNQESLRAPARSENPRIAELAAKAKEGDWTAFTEFKRLTRRSVLEQLARCGIQEQDDRLDLATDVYMITWRSLNRWRPDHAFTNLISTAVKVGRKSFWTVLTRTAPVRRDDDLDLWPSRNAPQSVPGDKTGCDWKAAAVSLPPSLRDALLARESGLSPDQISSKLGISLVEVWDRILEAEAAALKAAGLPVVNRWLERQLKKHDLLPWKALLFPGDIGEVVRHLPRRMRTGIYARIGGRGVDVAKTWGMPVITYHHRWNAAKRTLDFLARAYGVIGSDMQTVAAWMVAGYFDIGLDALRSVTAGLFGSSDFTWPEVTEIWECLKRHPVYKANL